MNHSRIAIETLSLISRVRISCKYESGRIKYYESSEITRSHFPSKIFTASVKSTSGGRAPADSMVTTQSRLRRRGKKVLDHTVNNNICQQY